MCIGSNCEVTFTVPVDNQIAILDNKQCVIIDEVDFVLLDKSTRIVNLKVVSMIIGLTATATGDMSGPELNYIKEVCGFNIYDSHMQSSKCDSSPAELCSLDKFLSSKFDHMARLIFCDESTFEAMDKAASDNSTIEEIFTNCDELKILQRIEPGQLLLVSEQYLMRGFDFRCPMGLALLVCKQFDSERSLR